jgi:hypothetical protein
MTEDERALRAAQNQALFREVNERIEALNTGFSLVLPMGDWVCECADDNCSERMSLTPAEYEAIRRHPDRFPVLPGHEVPEVETVVEVNDRYVVVEKFGAAKDFVVAHSARIHSTS